VPKKEPELVCNPVKGVRTGLKKSLSRHRTVLGLAKKTPSRAQRPRKRMMNRAETMQTTSETNQKRTKTVNFKKGGVDLIPVRTLEPAARPQETARALKKTNAYSKGGEKKREREKKAKKCLESQG